MGDLALTIQSVTVRAVDVPMERPVRTAVGSIPTAPLVLIDLFTRQGVIGRAYIFAYNRAALAPLAQMVRNVSAELEGKMVAPAERMREFDRRYRLLGWQGLVGMAVAGLDMAQWDAMARAIDTPLACLLGGEPRALPAYDSFGMVEQPEDVSALERSITSGFRAIKIKIGGDDLARDLATAKWVRDLIGSTTALMVDYNQSLDPVEARRRIAALAEYDISWVEEPVHARDLAGHARVRRSSQTPIQMGENWWFPRDMADAIAADACDLAMPDVGKIGGVSGWLQAAALANVASLPMSSHTFNEASAHLLAVTPTAHWLEYLDIAGAVLTHKLTPVDGEVTAQGPGIGLDWDEEAVAKHVC